MATAPQLTTSSIVKSALSYHEAFHSHILTIQRFGGHIFASLKEMTLASAMQLPFEHISSMLSFQRSRAVLVDAYSTGKLALLRSLSKSMDGVNKIAVLASSR
jgi:hypothetical protein